MTTHRIICTRNELAETMENLMEHSGKGVNAKQLDAVRYLVTWETEDEKMPEMQRIAELKNQVYNLTLYLYFIQKNEPELWKQMMNHYDGMGGYTEELLNE